MQTRNPESPIIGIFPKVTQKGFTVQRCPSVFTHTVHTLLWLLYDKSLHASLASFGLPLIFEMGVSHLCLDRSGGLFSQSNTLITRSANLPTLAMWAGAKCCWKGKLVRPQMET